MYKFCHFNLILFLFFFIPSSCQEYNDLEEMPSKWLFLGVFERFYQSDTFKYNLEFRILQMNNTSSTLSNENTEEYWLKYAEKNFDVFIVYGNKTEKLEHLGGFYRYHKDLGSMFKILVMKNNKFITEFIFESPPLICNVQIEYLYNDSNLVNDVNINFTTIKDSLCLIPLSENLIGNQSSTIYSSTPNNVEINNMIQGAKFLNQQGTYTFKYSEIYTNAYEYFRKFLNEKDFSEYIIQSTQLGFVSGVVLNTDFYDLIDAFNYSIDQANPFIIQSSLLKSKNNFYTHFSHVDIMIK